MQDRPLRRRDVEQMYKSSKKSRGGGGDQEEVVEAMRYIVSCQTTGDVWAEVGQEFHFGLNWWWLSSRRPRGKYWRSGVCSSAKSGQLGTHSSVIKDVPVIIC